MEKLQDFIIIGGGPAGSTMATQLVRKGYSVTVFEKTKFPREHVGESLLPFCYQMLDEMDILEDMKKYMVRKPGVMFISPDGKHKNTYCFNRVIHDESALSFHVLRAKFDDMLLKNSRRFGAVVHEETRVVSVELDRPDEKVKVEVKDAAGHKKTYWCRQLIDASGQDTFLLKKMQTKKPVENLNRVAFATHWMLESMPEYIDVGIQPIVYLGGNKAGWIFVIPVGVNRISVGVVVNNSYVLEEKSKMMEAGVRDWQEEFYKQELELSPYVVNLLKSAKRREGQPLMVIGDYSYYSDVKYGNDFALTGDSSAFLDPIFSSGVFLSMKSSFLLAEAYDKKFKGGNMKDNSALEEAYKNIDGAYQLIAKFIRYFYNPKALNLAELNNANMDLSDHINHETSFQLLHYLLAGDFFANHAKYNEMIDLLQDPKHFMRFKNLALDKYDRTTATCDYTTSDSYSKELMEEFMANA